MIEDQSDWGVTALSGTTKARIERAAVNLFAAEGAVAVTTRMIAADAGISEGALYRHFPSKADLAETLRQAAAEQLAADIAAIDASAPLGEVAAGLVDAYCTAAERDWMLFCYAFLRGAAPGPVEAAKKLVEGALNADGGRRGDGSVMTAMATGAILEVARHVCDSRVAGDLPQHKDALKRSVGAILRGHAEGS